MHVERRFRAMGTTVHLVVVDGDESLLDMAQARIDDLEQRWSRFLPSSELRTLNDAAGSGTPIPLSAITFELVTAALDAWRATGGLFDPAILPSLVAAGYNRSFEQGQSPPLPAPGHNPGVCARIAVDAAAASVALPAGCALDLGGIGKGRAADLVVEELLDRDVRGVCVNLGGDLRVAGEAPDGGEAWAVGLEEPDDPDTTWGVVGLRDGALATSSTTRRRWSAADGTTRHHLIDPRTGAPATAPLQSVTVIAASAMEAEVHAKASLIAGRPSQSALPMLFVHDDGRRESFAGFETYLW